MKTNQLFVRVLLFLAPFNFIFSQGALLPLHNPAYHTMDRMEIKSGIKAPFYAAIKGFTRGDITHYSMMMDTAQLLLSSRDKEDLEYIYLDNSEWLGAAWSYATSKETRQRDYDGSTQVEAAMADPRFVLSERPILKYFYQTPANFFDLNRKDFYFRVNPLVDFSIGKDNQDSLSFFHNQRGVQVRGGIDDRIYFFMNIKETQSTFPRYFNDWISKYKSLPGQGLYKGYKSDVFNIKGGYDYLNGQGYAGLNVTRHVGLQFGYGRNFIGNGYRSLILSDFSQNYLYLKINWRIWKFHYQNLFTELALNSSKNITGDNLIPKKYMAAHYLSFKIVPSLELGFYEAVIFSRSNHFEFQYLNPVILYRLVEHSLGSPDNVLIGLNAKWNLLNRFQLYGQLMLDEFKFDELILDRNGWWANKTGIQLGLKYIDVLGVDHLDLQVEYNTVAPYTYTHRDSTDWYGHYNQPLAHPLGANFKEWIFQLKYQPVAKLHLNAILQYNTGGESDENNNWGNDPSVSYITRVNNYGNYTGQGITYSTTNFRLSADYMVKHNLWLNAFYYYRDKDSELNSRDRLNSIIGAGVRFNIVDRDRMLF